MILISYKPHFERSVILIFFYNNSMILASVAKFLLRLCLLQMQNLEVKDTILKIKKTKTEIKKELEDSIINGGKN